MQRLLTIAATAMALSGCTPVSKPRSAAVSLVEEPGWRALVSTQDEQRITHLPDEWRRLLASVPVSYRRAVEREGALLSPDAGRDHPTPPPGSYRCRLVKLTPPATAGVRRREAPVRSFPDFFCYIRGEKDNELSFTKQTGTELPRGWLHRDGEHRLILVGARQREVGGGALAYGDEPARNVVGVVDRIGPFRWRLAIAGRDAQAGLDIYELTPVPSDQQVEEPRPAAPSVPAPATTTSGAVGRRPKT
ncbi:DUF4893 domain-containing protein [Sphingobium sufflavum]|uniref:DUF4893 domain-containing protein n=1 Tax=Sphingobium sufflavum TaxID=1129547 RepID=UPI001F3573DF|nr:DUF4893 domain-containing protein [Sphingobium sufflavum]MCE7796820.1 DUF4893 domain-containing protein [Sphingobium sufflavum]